MSFRVAISIDDYGNPFMDPPATFEVGQVKLLYLAINYLSHEKEVSSVVV